MALRDCVAVVVVLVFLLVKWAGRSLLGKVRF